MANSKIFCNIPWYELNINHDGSYDLCGCQNDKIILTPAGKVHNIKILPIEEYWNGERLREARLRKLGDEPDPMCKMCQIKDQVGYQSGRVKENIKSAIFPAAFDRSFEQSPGYKDFQFSGDNNGLTQTKPHSLHVNLGTHCNFACRMCGPYSSTKLKTEFKQLNWDVKELYMEHWTDTESGWNNFVNFLDNNRNDIKVVHIIGGEVEFIPKFQFLVDYFIEHNLASTINLSFTTNGSVDYTKYFSKFAKYKRIELGISIESVDPIGNYIRQGGNNIEILKNVLHLKAKATANMAFTIRTVPSLLSLPTYVNLIKWAWENEIPIDNSILVGPAWQRAALLSDEIKQNIINDLTEFMSHLPEQKQNSYINQKNNNLMASSIRNECEAMINLAKIEFPEDGDVQLTIAADKLSQWDKLKNTNLELYHTALFNLLSKYGYKYEGR